MSIGNRLVGLLLRSPFHRVLSSSTVLIRFAGRRTGRTFTTPVQYARRGDDLIIFVARPSEKVWWRNFRIDNWIEVLMRGSWVTMSGFAFVGAEEPTAIRPLLDAYIGRFPRVGRSLTEGRRADLVHGAVIVRCSPA